MQWRSQKQIPASFTLATILEIGRERFVKNWNDRITIENPGTNRRDFCFMNKKIAIQGFEGSFHQAAARRFFGNDVEVICCSTFRDVVKIADDAFSDLV